MSTTLRLGTRGSPLALTQANMVADALRAAHGLDADAIEIVPIRTSGDRIQHVALAEVGGKALWTKELDAALLDGRIDLAIHSMKDVETIRPAEIALAAMLPRADVRDRLIGAASIDALPHGARIGTSSPRRAAQLLALRPDLVVTLFRGNVATRLAKLAAGEADATLLAAAGLDRLGRQDVGTAIPVDTMLPAASQGAVGIEVRADDRATWGLVHAIDDRATHLCVEAERGVLKGLGGDCRSPVAALAVWNGDAIRLRAQILSPDGRESHASEVGFVWPDGGYPPEPEALAHALLGAASADLRALFA